jgi:hypothetical protein
MAHITRLNPKMAAHTSLGLLLLLCCCRCQILQPFWNHNSIDSATFKLSAMPLDLSGFIFRRVAWSRTYHLSLKFSSKFNAPFSFNGKIMPTKNVIELAFLQKSLIMFYCLLLGKTRSYFVSSNDEKLDDLEVSTKYC